ncbi:integrin alpha-4 [Lingula anatina]|uniref:Integrin alpha-4 n=1 Tax=Lingula anatina TaxID=7574 RepID=A0A1S3HVP2_LINAN|nr:integrin alpha-4 [Lingula anatina]|eukprot:XP_013389616.2 integrin alpha-4 [Lingula anatina]
MRLQGTRGRFFSIGINTFQTDMQLQRVPSVKTSGLPVLFLMWCLLFCCCCFNTRVQSFNVDTKNAVIFKGPPRSRFGFSVVLHKNDAGYWVLAGAPNSKSKYQRSVLNPGALYKCEINGTISRGCSQVKLDNKGNRHKTEHPLYYYSRKEEQLLGLALDNQNGPNASVVICAPQWKDQRYRNHYLVNGMCYTINNNLDFSSVKQHHPMTVLSQQITQQGVYYYALGQAGFSAHYMKDGNMLLGAVGMYDWLGGLVHVDKTGRSENFIPDPRVFDNDSYIGYAVSSGKFFPQGNLNYVTGAPRMKLTGKVYIWSNTFRLLLEKEGQQFGSNFGAAVLGVDLTGNGLSDLVVGAPMYSAQAGDEGRVYVYINKDLGVLEQLAEPLSGSNVPGARFGSALAAIGDVNLDGFQDIAVGAPYEDQMRGCVYIYHGHPAGLRRRPAQRIPAADIDRGLRAFGSAIGKGLDVNKDRYKDLIVGSNSADSAVLLYSRPVVMLTSSLTADLDHFHPEMKTCSYRGQEHLCVTLRAGFMYNGHGLPDYLDIKYTIRLDTYQPTPQLYRASFTINGLNAIQQTVLRLRRGVTEYNETDIFIKTSVKDILTPINIVLDAELEETSLKASGCISCPVLDAYKVTTSEKQLHFLHQCGSDNLCHTDLQLQSSVSLPGHESVFLLGSEAPLQVHLHVKNNGEAAYGTEVIISHHPVIEFVKVVGSDKNDVTVTCSPMQSDDYIDTPLYVSLNNSDVNATVQIICDIGNPIPANGDVELVVYLDASKLRFETRQLKIESLVRTGSVEANVSLANNVAIDTIPVKFHVISSLTGASNPEQITYTKQDVKGDKFVEFTQRVDIRNLGPSPLPEAVLEVLVPKATEHGDRLLYLDVVELENDNVMADKGLSCFLPSGQASESGSLATQPTIPGAFTPDFMTLPTVAMPTDETPDEGVEDDIIVVPVSASAGKKWSWSEVDYVAPKLTEHSCRVSGECWNYTCAISNLRAGESVLLTIAASVLFGQLQHYTVSADGFSIVSEVTLKGRHPRLLDVNSLERSVRVSTPVHPSDLAAPEGIKSWVLGVSISVGILLLLILVLILWRCGFFKRKTHEELERLMKEEEEDPWNGSVIEGEEDRVAVYPPADMNNHNHNGTFQYRPVHSDDDYYEQPISVLDTSY